MEIAQTQKKCPKGTFGENCSEQCPDNMYGELCAKRCDCKANQVCNRVDGCIDSKYSNNKKRFKAPKTMVSMVDEQ
uniref:Uncharacterized protein n=1 Tax=Magallana gigas TaxID=29159 RepID=K1PAH1_MAGGI